MQLTFLPSGKKELFYTSIQDWESSLCSRHFCYSALLLPPVMTLKTNKTKLLISRNNGISDKTKLSITLFFLWVLHQIGIPDFTNKPDLLPLCVLWKSTSKLSSSITFSSKNYQTYSIMKYVPGLSFHTSWNIFFQYLVNPDFKEDILIVHIYDIFPSKPKKKYVLLCGLFWWMLSLFDQLWLKPLESHGFAKCIQKINLTSLVLVPEHIFWVWQARRQ